MFNRATQGIYAPGSTFKLCTSVAALEEGIITPTTIIQDKGIYTYYKDPQPMCWIWRQARTTHGRINVSQAIVDFRQAQGGFHFIEDLLAVPGIGTKRLEAVRDLITLSPPHPGPSPTPRIYR